MEAEHADELARSAASDESVNCVFGCRPWVGIFLCAGYRDLPCIARASLAVLGSNTHILPRCFMRPAISPA